MEQILNPISITKNSELSSTALQPVRSEAPIEVHSPDNALSALTSEPDLPALERILRWLDPSTSNQRGFNVLSPGPKAAQIIFVLVNEILPTHWRLLKEEKTSSARRSQKHLLRCLRSSAGCGAIASHIRSQIDDLKGKTSQKNVTNNVKTAPLAALIEVLEHVLSPDNLLATLWTDIGTIALSQTRVSLLWKETVSLFASGKLLSLVGEANHVLNEVSSDVREGSWIGKGDQYAKWLGRNISHVIDKWRAGDAQDSRKAILHMVGKALTLGYPVQVVETAYSRLLSGDESLIQRYRAILVQLHAHEQKLLLYSLIRVLSTRQLNDNSEYLRGAAAVISALCADSASLRDQSVGWLFGNSPEAVVHSHATRRAVVLALSSDVDRVKSSIWRALELFSDKLFIKHAPILHQEVNIQVMLMLAGHAHRHDKKFLSIVSKSSAYLNGISNHLAASSPRARFLGMVVGRSMSELLDEPGKQLQFKAEDSKSAEWRWYKELISLNDQIGSIADLKPLVTLTTLKTTGKIKKQSTSPISNGNSAGLNFSSNSTSRVVKIEEIDEDSESEDDDLPVYAKPDSDPSDDDDDPTLVQRNKPTIPVYIRDLLSGLRNTEDFDRHTLALKNAPSLIRRKTNFGTEVTDHVEELASIFVGLKDRWDFEDFTKLRLQAMLAVLVAEPLRMGQWFSRAFYNGDYSLGQRVSILTTLGLGAREIAGMGKDDANITGAAASKNPFPSKRLPDKLHNLYALEAAPLSTLSTQLEQTMIQPLAASAADKLTGPNALKIRTFSSRMSVEKKRQKPISNALAKIVSEGFFFPLTGRWAIQIQAFGTNAPQSSPLLLSHLLKTLSLILHAAGLSTVTLPQLTAEFWSFLLNIRSSSSAADPSVLEALLFSFLTLLDVNVDSQRRLAEEHAKELLETQAWASSVLEKLGGGDEEGERCRMLAAGVLVRCREVVEKYQRLLMGDLVDFM